MRRVAATALGILLALGGCGDDAKVGSRGTPPAPPGGPPALPAPSDAAGPRADAAATRAGDWATWEVRVPGSDAVTRVTWRAVSAEGGRVRLRIESRTQDATGRTIASVDTEETRPAVASPPEEGDAETLTVAGRSIPTRRTTRGETTLWRSGEVPLGGIVRSRGPGGAEQTLVAFGRGG